MSKQLKNANASVNIDTANASSVDTANTDTATPQAEAQAPEALTPEAQAEAEAQALALLEKQKAEASSVKHLIQAHRNATQAEAEKARLTEAHAKVQAQAEALELLPVQVAKLRAQYGISDSLDNDLKTLEVAPHLTEALAKLDDPSVAVWRTLEAVSSIEAQLTEVNALRQALGKAPLFLAWQSVGIIPSTRARTVKGDNGSEAHESGSAKFMRPGVVKIKFANMQIVWTSTLEAHTLTVDGSEVSKRTPQGATGLATVWREFIQNELLRPKTNDSLPQRLLDNGYTANDVYMYTAPTTDTAQIKQPVSASA